MRRKFAALWEDTWYKAVFSAGGLRHWTEESDSIMISIDKAAASFKAIIFSS